MALQHRNISGYPQLSPPMTKPTPLPSKLQFLVAHMDEGFLSLHNYCWLVWTITYVVYLQIGNIFRSNIYLQIVYLSKYEIIIRIQVSCSAEDHSTVRDGRFPFSKYSRMFLYIAGHLSYLDTSSNQASNKATFSSYPSDFLVGYEPKLQSIFIDKAFILFGIHFFSLLRSTPSQLRTERR